MSGRTFGYQASWADVLKLLAPSISDDDRRKASAVADSMNQQIEEFLNRYVLTSTNDNGDITFDAAGTYTFEGNVVIEGELSVTNAPRTVKLTPDLNAFGAGNFVGLQLYNKTAPDFPGFFGVDDSDPGKITARPPYDTGDRSPDFQLVAGGPSAPSSEVILRADDITLSSNSSSGEIGLLNCPVRVNDELLFGGPGVDDGLTSVTGTYGSVQTVGSGAGGYEGYSISGRAVFMHEGTTTTGIYDDVNNAWLFYGSHGSHTRMYGNGTIALYAYQDQVRLGFAGTAGTPALTWNGDTNTGIYADLADGISFTGGAVRTFQFTAGSSFQAEDGTGKNPQICSEDRTTASRLHLLYGTGGVGYIFNTANQFYYGTSTMGPVEPAITSGTTTWRVTANGVVTDGYQLDRPSSSIQFKDNIEDIDGAFAVDLLRRMRPVRYEGTEDVKDGLQAKNPWRHPEINEWCLVHGPQIARENGGKIPPRFVVKSGKMKQADIDAYTTEELSGFEPCHCHPDYERMPQYGFIAEEQYALDPILTEFFDDSITDAPTVALLTAALVNLANRLDAAGL